MSAQDSRSRVPRFFVRARVGFALLIGMGSWLGAFACDDPERDPEPEDAGAAGSATGGQTGGRNPGGAGTGTGGSSQTGGAGNAGETGAGTGGSGEIGGAGAGGVPECTGIEPGQNSWEAPRTRFEQVRCYVAEAEDGVPECLPPGPEVIPLVDEFILSIGFAPLFVIEQVESVPIPSECGELAACCAASTDARDASWRTANCEGVFNRPQHPTAETCSSHSCEGRGTGGEGGGSASGGGEGGASEGGSGGASPTLRDRALCCYRTCGYSHRT